MPCTTWKVGRSVIYELPEAWLRPRRLIRPEAADSELVAWLKVMSWQAAEVALVAERLQCTIGSRLSFASVCCEFDDLAHGLLPCKLQSYAAIPTRSNA